MTGPGTDAASRLDYLDAMSARLWPGSRRVHRRGPGRRGELLIGPSVKHPRVLLPGTNRRAAANALLAQGVGSGRAAHLQRRALAAVTRAGLAPWLMSDRLQPGLMPSITEHLSMVLDAPIEISSALTPQRANRKPVLHVLSPAGQSIAWVKVGVNDLTADLVNHEADALAELDTSGLRSALDLPAIRHRGEWNGLHLLVLSALPTRHATRTAPDLLQAAMQAVCQAPTAQSGTGRPYAEALAGRAAHVAAGVSGADAAALEQLRAILTGLCAINARVHLGSGSWHGDWTPWNCGQYLDRVLVWDWERFVSGVPRGFDALHYQLQDALVTGGVSHRDAARDCIDAAPRTLAAWSLSADAARLTAALYLVEIALRYLADGQRAAGGFGAAIETWIVPTLLGYQQSAGHADVKDHIV